MAGFSMFDTMRHVKSEVSTINVGLAASMGSLLLVGGTKGKRLALPHSRVMIHQPAMGGIQGQASDIKVEAEMILGIRERRTYGLGYSHGLYYGKREAEAEPEADAYYGYG